MKIFVLIALALCLPGCQPEETAPEEPTPPTTADLRAISLQKAALLNEKKDLLDQLDGLIDSTNLDPDGRLKALETQTRDARARFLELRQSHPLFLKLNADLTRWQGEVIAAETTRRSEQAERARNKLIEVRSEIAAMSKSIPEFGELQQTIAGNEHQAREVRKELAKDTPEGQEMVDRIEQINAELEEF